MLLLLFFWSKKLFLPFTFYIWKLRDYISLLLKITLLRHTHFIRTSHFDAEVESSLNCLVLLPLPHVPSPLSPPALPLLHPYPPPSPALPLSHLFSSFPLRRLFTFFRHVFMFWALDGVQKYRYVLKSYHEFDLMGWQVNLFIFNVKQTSTGMKNDT